MMTQCARALREHWPEYLMEAAGLGLFMVSACVFVVLLEYPASSVHQAIPAPALRRSLIGLAMGLTAIGLIYSSWGQQSGAHLNPAVTLTFLRLGKIAPADALFYVLSQFAGGLIGVLVSAVALGRLVADPSVNYVVTVPGMEGTWIAFLAELVISFGLMLAVLTVSNTKTLAPLTGVCAGILVATYIALEAPLSGMSMNPARTVASALPAHVFTALWVYLMAPVIGMLLAAEAYLHCRGTHRVFCAKLHHGNHKRCIFRCNFAALVASQK